MEKEVVAKGPEEVAEVLAGWMRRIRCLDLNPFLDHHERDQRPVNPRHAQRIDPYHGFRKGAPYHYPKVPAKNPSSIVETIEKLRGL